MAIWNQKQKKNHQANATAMMCVCGVLGKYWPDPWKSTAVIIAGLFMLALFRTIDEYFNDNS